MRRHILSSIYRVAEGILLAVLADTVLGCMKQCPRDKKVLPVLDKTRDYFRFPRTTHQEPVVSEAMYIATIELIS